MWESEKGEEEKFHSLVLVLLTQKVLDEKRLLNESEIPAKTQKALSRARRVSSRSQLNDFSFFRGIKCKKFN